MADREYNLGQSPDETQRLMRQAQSADRDLRQLFEDAGVGPGMRVLDLGSGAGDVALTAAQFVGEAGSVLGIDRNPTILEMARERARAAGYQNVTFMVCDLDQKSTLDGEFDALIGRFVLIYVADPVATLRSTLRYVRSEGVVAFVDVCLSAGFPKALPPSPLFTQVASWLHQSRVRAGMDLDIGMKLHQIFLDAGLPQPQMRAQLSVSAGADSPILQNNIGQLRSTRPALIQHGIATEEELDVERIAAQLEAEFQANQTTILGGLTLSAWARKP